MMDLLDLAQNDNNTFKVNEETFSLPKVINDSLEIVGHIAKLRSI